MSADPSELMVEIGQLVADAIADGVLETATIERKAVAVDEPDTEWGASRPSRQIIIDLWLAE